MPLVPAKRENEKKPPPPRDQGLGASPATQRSRGYCSER
jgi:hypothetical protein